MVQEHEQEFLNLVQQKSNARGKKNLRQFQKELSIGQERLQTIDKIINKLYEDKVVGELSAERFSIMLATYEEEQSKLRSRLDELRSSIAAEQEKTSGAEQFIRLVKRFTEIKELTDEIVATFIEKVEVHEPKKIDGQKRQKITVHYNFIGTMLE